MRVTLALIVSWLAACRQGATDKGVPGAVVREAKVTRGDLTERVLLTGNLRAAAAVDLNVPKTEVWQLTIRWMAEDGTLVKAGDKVLEFDNSQFTAGLEQKRLQMLEANSSFRAFRDLATMNTAVKNFEVASHRVALDKAKLLSAVPPDLLPQRTVQERSLEKTRAEVALTRAENDMAADRQAAGLETRVKQIELDKTERSIKNAEKSIGDLAINAPRDGVILIGTHPWEGRRFQTGDTVQPGFTIMTLPDLSVPMRVLAELSDVDDGRIAMGVKGTCTLDAYPREPIPCTVDELAPVARSNSMESLRRVFAVGLALAKSDPDRMRPGMSIKIELPGPTHKAALLVPRGAVIFGKQPKVRLPGGDTRDVSVIACNAQQCAIDTGVTEGEAVQETP
ncbi:MAG: HlyD family efflux transporter periplasmic adaptor subunit [Kofleriaceae bacterium]